MDSGRAQRGQTWAFSSERPAGLGCSQVLGLRAGSATSQASEWCSGLPCSFVMWWEGHTLGQAWGCWGMGKCGHQRGHCPWQAPGLAALLGGRGPRKPTRETNTPAHSLGATVIEGRRFS